MSQTAKAATNETARDEQIEKALANRQARIWIRFGVRVVIVAIVSAFVTQRVAFLAANRSVIDAISGVVVLWPLWTQLGQLYMARIDEGKHQSEQKQWAAARRILAPFAAPPVSRLFDATGEGTYFLARALEQLGETDKARALHAQNARPTEWGEKSAEALEAQSPAPVGETAP